MRGRLTGELKRRGFLWPPRNGKALDDAIPFEDDVDLPEAVRLAARLEPKLRRRFLASMTAIKEKLDEPSVLAALTAAIISGTLNAILAPIWEAELDGILKPGTVDTLQTAFLRGAQVGADALGPLREQVRFDLINSHAVNWARERAAKLITEVTLDQKLGVSILVEHALREGRTVTQVARDIRTFIGLHSRQQGTLDRFRARLVAAAVDPDVIERRVERKAAGLLRQRSEVIARTEVVWSANAGQREAWQSAARDGLFNPKTARRQWVVTPDDLLDEMLCIHASCKVLTLDGWKRVSRVQPGEQVLTHRDRFRPVLAVVSRHYTGQAVQLRFSGRANLRLTATYGHRVWTGRGWIPIEQITAQDTVWVSAVPCQCGALVPYGLQGSVMCTTCQTKTIAQANRVRWQAEQAHVALSQLNKARWSQPAYKRTVSAAIAAGIAARSPEQKEAIRSQQRLAALARPPRPKKPKLVRRTSQEWAKEWAQHPNHPFRRKDLKVITAQKLVAWIKGLSPEARAAHYRKCAHASHVTLGKQHGGASFLERKMKHFLETQGITFEAQWQFLYDDAGRQRQGIADFYVPGVSLVIECDGFMHETPQAKARDELKNAALLAQGKQILRFTDQQIRHQFHDVASTIRQHCCLLALRPKTIRHFMMRHQAVTDLTVADDHSFIAGGVVVHNCEPMAEPELGVVDFDSPWELPDGRKVFVPQESHPQCRCAMNLLLTKDDENT